MDSLAVIVSHPDQRLTNQQVTSSLRLDLDQWDGASDAAHPH
jgi:hypothetical protein